MNPYALLAALALYGCTLTYAVWERADAIKARADLSTLKASYATQAAAAVTHAQAIEAADLKALNAQSTTAIQQAKTQADNAQQQLRNYQARLNADAGMKDPGHVCSGVEVPKDLLP